MKKSIIGLFTIILSINGFTQEWAPIGAQWHYENQNMFSNIRGYFDFQVIGDTVVLGKSCRIIKSNGYRCLQRPLFEITYESNDSVYFLNPADSFNTFQLHYFWAAQKSDFWLLRNISNQLPFGFPDSMYIYVDSTDSIVINGKILRRQWVSYGIDTANRTGIGEHIELIGSSYYLFDTEFESGSCDSPYPTELRCYNDTFLGNYNRISSDSCNQIKDFTNIKQVSQHNEIRIFPNPTSDLLYIVSSSLILKIEIRDGKNSINHLWFSHTNNFTLNLSEFPSGLYYLIITDIDDNQQSQIVIRN